jgi:hypothetical protein
LTTGFVASGDGGFGVVAVVVVVLEVVVVLVVGGAEAAVAPDEGASSTPGAFELPQAARPAPSAAAKIMAMGR